MFKSKVVIVTGSSSGIGARAAVRFAKEGAAGVVITGRRGELLEKVKKECEAASQGKGKILVVVGDISEDNVRAELINGTVKEFGRLDILVNNAAVGMVPTPMSQIPIDVFDNVFNINVRSLIQLTQLAIPHLVSSKGNIVNVSSVAAVKAIPPFAFYCMSKAALDHYTRCLAVELGPQGVRVNSFEPGSIAGTDLMRDYIQDENYVKLREQMVAKTPVQRRGNVDEAANVILFLASDQASFVTGSVTVADGGQILV